ncbi:nucleotide exchange factor GrpE [Halomarina salina]|uniref:Protein GrpE n=1 Tax=Halomarina salina TaxID=1872699 RepID=A0ABD5RJ30_9EURY|nr:nucleotide exchange factor GrpE [Halomarina salina]
MTEETPDADHEATDDRRSDAANGGADDGPDRHATEPGTTSDAQSADDGEADTAVEAEAETAAEDLVERVRESDPEAVAREIADLRARAEEADRTAEDLESKLARTQADFQNYKKRMEKRREQEKKRATEDLVTRMVDVRDNLQRGLEQEGDIREGVESTLRQFDDVLDAENVEEISPDPGDEVDPQRHEVLMRVASDRPEGTVAQVHRPGYEMAEKVVRSAQVTVSDGDDENEE